MQNEKVMFFDIETTPNLGFFWGLGKQVVTYSQISKEKKISCICWKWLGDKKVYHLQMNLSKHSINEYDDDADKEMLVKFCKEYAKADNVVAHNGIRFDKGTIIARLAKYGLSDLSYTVFDDTYLQSRHINFNCHKLDYLARYFEVGHKIKTDYDLWVKVMSGSKQALNDTVKYCKQDVVLLEKVYNKLKPYIKIKFNKAVFQENQNICPSCGSSHLVRSTMRKSVNLGIRLQLRCAACGKIFTTGQNQLKNSSKYPRPL